MITTNQYLFIKGKDKINNRVETMYFLSSLYAFIFTSMGKNILIIRMIINKI